MHNLLECAECGGSSSTQSIQTDVTQAAGKKKYIEKKCPHGRRRAHCKLCGGGSICSHGRLRAQCRDCGGSQICAHGRKRPSCKLCGGGSICEHGRVRYICRDCGGSQICAHGRQRKQCKECNGSMFCEHGRRRNRCIQCGGSSMCEHGRRRANCKICGGASVCEHGRLRQTCKTCGGSAICKHENLRASCKICGGTAMCRQCKEVRGIRKYEKHCLRCFIHLFPGHAVFRNYKTKEVAVGDFIDPFFSHCTILVDKRIPDGCSQRRPDRLIDFGEHVLILEVDENQHRGYTCTNKRICELSEDVGHRPITIVRFNPDGYTKADGTHVTSCWGTTPKKEICIVKPSKKIEWDERLNILKERMLHWMNNPTMKMIHVDHLFYDEVHPDDAQNVEKEEEEDDDEGNDIGEEEKNETDEEENV